MIPSRPLSLIEIITETFALYGRMFSRYALLAILLFVPGVCFVSEGLISFSEDTIAAARHDIDFNDNDLTTLRNEFKIWMAAQNPLLASPEIAQPKHDSTAASLDTLSHARAGDAHQIRYYVRTNAARFATPLSMMVIGSLLLLIGIFALVSMTTDFACQAFEERGWDVRDALIATFKKNAWKILFLYCLYTLVCTAINRLLLMADNVVVGAIAGLMTVAQIYVAVRSVAMFPAIVSEEIGPFEGFRRSWELTRGSGGRIFFTSIMFVFILFFVTVVVSTMIGVAFGSVFAWWEQWDTSPHLTVAWFLRTLPGFLRAASAELSITFLLIFALVPIFLTVFYYDLRTRRDGPLIYIDEPA